MCVKLNCYISDGIVLFLSTTSRIDPFTSYHLTLQIMTPFLTAKLAGKYVAVDAAGLLMSTLQVSFSQILFLYFLFFSLITEMINETLF